MPARDNCKDLDADYADYADLSEWRKGRRCALSDPFFFSNGLGRL
jgi:hypothetical protein